MRKRLLAHPRLWIALLGAVVVCLAPLAFLQFKWIDEISRAAREMRQTSLSGALMELRQELLEVVRRKVGLLEPGLTGPKGFDLATLAAHYTRLRQSDELSAIRNLYFVQGGQDLLAYDPATQSFRKTEWTPQMETLRRTQGSGEIEPGSGLYVLRVRRQARDGPPVRDFAVVELDLDYVAREVLPRAIRRELLSRDNDYAIQVTGGGRVLYRSDPALPDSFFDAPDRTAFLLPFFGVPGGEARSTERHKRPHPPEHAKAEPTVIDGKSVSEQAWVIRVRHRSGSLAVAIERARSRNLATSAFILVLIALCLGALFAAVRSAQQLSRMEMEFVAGVSHELRTPLAVIRSSAENLADGVVADGERVRRYGSVIAGEARRLAQMVEQILRFAASRNGLTHTKLLPCAVRDLADEAIRGCEPVLKESGCKLDLDVPPGLPSVQADPPALICALRNLIENAIVHGKGGQWVGVSAVSVAGEVEITIADHGPGIDPAELPHVFDPFVRGRKAVRDQAHGFGLGLALARSIVEAHRGRLTIESSTGEGTRALVRLPAALQDETHDQPIATPDTADRG